MAEKEIKEKRTRETQKTIGEYGYVRVNIFADEFQAVKIKPEMLASEASEIIRSKLGLDARMRARDPTNALLRDAKKMATDSGRLEELKKALAKFTTRN